MVYRRLTEKRYKIFGREQPPMKIYRTCTFADLGSRKDEFLGKVVEMIEEKGLKKAPPIKPFDLTIGVKDGLRLWDSSIWYKIGRREMVGTDVFLMSDHKGAETTVALRAETKGDDLRFGYFYAKWHKPKSVAEIKLYLKTIAGICLLFIWGFFVGLVLLGKPFYQAHGAAITIFALVTLLMSPTIPIIYIIYRRDTGPRKEIDRRVLEIAESMGGEQITPFKNTTVKLED